MAVLEKTKPACVVGATQVTPPSVPSFSVAEHFLACDPPDNVSVHSVSELFRRAFGEDLLMAVPDQGHDFFDLSGYGRDVQIQRKLRIDVRVGVSLAHLWHFVALQPRGENPTRPERLGGLLVDGNPTVAYMRTGAVLFATTVRWNATAEGWEFDTHNVGAHARDDYSTPIRVIALHDEMQQAAA